eukprot:scaffold289_cov144-Skeletonema_menzelii.AAC.12
MRMKSKNLNRGRAVGKRALKLHLNQGYLAKCPKSAASSTAVNNTAANCTIAKSPKSTANSTVAKSSKSAAISAKSPKSAATYVST